MYFNFANVLVFLVVAFLFVGVTLLVGRLFRPSRPGGEKGMTYECGEVPTGGAWINMNPRFYLIALVFIIFDVEIAFIFPVARVFRELTESGAGLLVLGEILVFVLILFAGLVFVWGRGDLRWLKAIGTDADEEAGEPRDRLAA